MKKKPREYTREETRTIHNHFLDMCKLYDIPYYDMICEMEEKWLEYVRTNYGKGRK